MPASHIPSRPKPAPRPKPHPRFGRWSAFLAGVGVGLTAVLADGGLKTTQDLSTTQPADSLTEVTAKSWTKIIRRTLKEFTDDRISAVAAGSAFYALLALFPA